MERDKSSGHRQTRRAPPGAISLETSVTPAVTSPADLRMGRRDPQPSPRAVLEDAEIAPHLLDQQSQELATALVAAESEADRYRGLFESAPLPVLVLDRLGVVRRANHMAGQVFGVSASALLVNRSIYRLIDAGSANGLHQYLSRSAALTDTQRASPPQQVMIDIPPKGNGIGHRTMEAHLALLPAVLSDVGDVQMLLVDRTKAAERERRSMFSEAFLKGATSLMHAFDREGQLAFANPITRAHTQGADPDLRKVRSRFNGLLGSRAMDIEVLTSGRPCFAPGVHVMPSGERRNFIIGKFPIHDETGAHIAVGGISTDITEIIEPKSDLERAFDQARTTSGRDPLTRLMNRTAFMEQINEEIGAAETSGSELFLSFIDIDSFKETNDAMGHEVGDALLCAIARRMEDAVGEMGYVARFGGDEFLLFLAHRTAAEAEACLERILREIRTPYEVAGTQIILTCSVGLSSYPRDGATAEELLRAADLALYASKSGGRDRITLCSDDLRTGSERRLRILSSLRTALAEDNFRLVFQPKVDLRNSRRIVGAEALLRWRDPHLGEVAPLEFVPLAEMNGLSNALDLRVLKLFAEQQKSLFAKGVFLPISVNISARSLHAANFVSTVLSFLDFNNIPPELLILEITETSMLRFSSDTTERLAQLTAAGVRLSIDDFGTGYASLLYLEKMNTSELKIDRSFVAKLGIGEMQTERIVQAILALGRGLGIEVVAEGVETETQREWLVKNECTVGQGFLFKRPQERESFERLLI
ncbi:putative bifunctional diguanylate cyclase/phosphodiesterase [Rhodovulum strictum]|uniref:EAL domain-containing protein n=1 Tax=Rhodovulum strictum TaxID=58314 RepID=A0A844BNS5_9RHOB|nr:EAL domain-containing protein [Rhodovulum strictum]MRH22583.1 EAL domain-containing protein [Rhodovulum strictum]